MTIHEQYHALAEKSLKSGRIDAEAYLVKVLSEMAMVTNHDRVPESQIDEEIDTMQDMLVEYMHDKTIENLSLFLVQSQKILSEVYHDCETPEKRNLCKKAFDEISKIC